MFAFDACGAAIRGEAAIVRSRSVKAPAIHGCREIPKRPNNVVRAACTNCVRGTTR